MKQKCHILCVCAVEEMESALLSSDKKEQVIERCVWLSLSIACSNYQVVLAAIVHFYVQWNFTRNAAPSEMNKVKLFFQIMRFSLELKIYCLLHFIIKTVDL